MHRLERIQAALHALNPCGQPNSAAVERQSHLRIGRTTLTELTDCLFYLCFPELVNPSARIAPPYVQPSHMMEWVLGHVADMMSSQICAAFALHGDAHAVDKLDEFAPLQSAQRTPLDWSVPSGGTLSVVPDSDDKSATACGGGRVERSAAPVASGPPPANGLLLTRCKAKAEAITTKFMVERLPHVRWLLHTDVEAIFKNDVAATSPSEVVLCYPAVRCMLHQRVAHQLYLLGVPTNFTRMLTEIAHSLTGIDIHPRTSIGHHFFIDHGTGIVIGATAVIGNYVSLYQGVTLGAKSFPTDKKTGELILNLPRHPIIEDGVTIYANAVVLGRVTIGEGSTIGGNCWVVQSIPPHSSIAQKSNRVLQPNERMFFEEDGSGI